MGGGDNYVIGEVELTSSSTGTMPCPLPIAPTEDLPCFAGASLLARSDILSSRGIKDEGVFPR